MKAETKFTNLHNLREYFNTEEKCREYLEKARWNNKPVCPFCNCDKVYKLKNGKTYKCADCTNKFTVTVGTIFENTKIPLSKWFIAMYILTSHTKGISSIQLSKDVGITQKSAWFVNHRIREMLKDKCPSMLNGMVEADETFVGGKEKNKHKDKRTEHTQGRSTETKTVVFGLLDRENKTVEAKKIPNVKKVTLHPIIKERMQKGTTLVTDEWRGYNGLSKAYNHLRVNHNKGIYVDGIAHTNTIDGFWSLFKRGIIGIYHSVSEKHIDRYVTEFSQRYNRRNFTETGRFDSFLEQCEGRLKYKNLIK